ncbi:MULTISPECIES: fibrillarin-like rRNA/tRNA 2'-O-methyltransferase [Haloarcula]|uniref:Fibrillarin-like rRNA/tRNA 2'-O-methyltransferase n=1 Tax=Haloarcula pellucida TaxID=1427151 RepID=A0A830GGG1_9EURY|nr:MULTISPECIES: fibrillarin-like rRNA/tRNA 2'-O-methyltransferase [Halomicroarcula]MBX0347206.1 fibrillarin-like rRNA/tRNA 2'-O-methyltransferase [Halomicroarcula pellucida]MDS0276918.1 fibrillarin-like rRNA/tRNA 2'-O-methyltransferase [Halomicroarcula sp. S1AR25-4]QIO22667.1 fibrillarin-like rRNA/tRNA 2'-O-methyltransferase [Haloarcula sp. JP-L23]GGN87503.1 fibrillarin-like rRNA methylase [Halomicroarcula pellucida]
MSLPDGVSRHDFDGTTSIATRGHPEYGERTDGEWRRWDPHRSKLGAMLELGMETGLTADQTTLYLGAAAGTTVSHVADFGGPTYAVEFAPRPTRDLLDVAERRSNLFPLLKDARKPETYAHVVEPVDVLVQDVATRGQGRVATLNRQFLADDGYLLAAIKARSEDVTADPEDVFDEVLADIDAAYDVVATERLTPYHDDHLGVVARPER